MNETQTPEIHDADHNPEDVLPGESETTVRPDAADLPGHDREDVEDTFSRAYVEKLRQEAAGYRVRAQRTTELEQRLHAALVAATGRLTDSSDLEFDPAHLDDEDALSAALDELLTRKPHLASRRPRGDVGQGVTSNAVDTVDLAGILRSLAN